jgi:serine/threonine-protein kinase RsbT
VARVIVMTSTAIESLPLQTSDDVVLVRQAVRRVSLELAFSLVDQTKIITAASELARNTIQYGGGGHASMEVLTDGTRRGLRLTFSDQGPGIADLSRAMTDGFSTGGGLGLGLSGARRLSHDFDITSEPGAGTRVSITRWK